MAEVLVEGSIHYYIPLVGEGRTQGKVDKPPVFHQWQVLRVMEQLVGVSWNEGNWVIEVGKQLNVHGLNN